MTSSVETVPPGKLRTVVTYLEMHRRPDRALAAAPRSDMRIIEAKPPTIAFYRFLYGTVGEPWLWFERRRWTDARLRAEIEDPGVETHVLYASGSPAGYAELDFRHDRDVELRYFGIVPEFIGQRLGPYLLDWSIDYVWRRDIGRYWVHTCTLDHPRALPLYRQAGFVPYDEQVEIVDDPRLDGTIPARA